MSVEQFEPPPLEPPPPRILVVDDESSIRDALSYTLRKEGYRVDVVATGTEAIQAVRKRRPDVVVLDVMLPGIDGIQVCRTLRSESTVPILLLSARGEEIDRVVGLEVGADDYLTKPFAMRELLARIRAILRRVHMMQPVWGNGVATDPNGTKIDNVGMRANAPSEAPVVLGDLVVDRARRVAMLGDAMLTLRPKEFDLLYFLAQYPGVVHSRDVLLRRVWGYDFPFGTRTVDVHVRWLRQKIELDPSHPARLETVRGFGYRLAPPAQDGR
ncbi:MAG: response regulator transcription factor [Chloroflexia bacterium]|nr:response regulator transcription factor [Chloroflexia bacterium]